MDIAIITIYILLLCFAFIMLKKNNRTYEMRVLVCNAMYSYNLEQIKNGHFDEILVCKTEPYDKTLWRLTDWGYTNIVPPDVLEKILPYIESKEVK